MKKFLAVLLISALTVCLLASCGGKGGKDAQKEEAPAAPAASAPAGTAAPAPSGGSASASAPAAPAPSDPAPAEDEDPEPEDYWEKLRWRWRHEKEEGYVWTITIDAVTVLDAMGLTKSTYDLDLSCSHVGTDMNGIYCGSLAMDFEADLSGLNQMMGAMGGTASTSNVDGWFRNDEFVMELVPYNAEKEQGFIGSLDIKVDENGNVI